MPSASAWSPTMPGTGGGEYNLITYPLGYTYGPIPAGYFEVP